MGNASLNGADLLSADGTAIQTLEHSETRQRPHKRLLARKCFQLAFEVQQALLDLQMVAVTFQAVISAEAIMLIMPVSHCILESFFVQTSDATRRYNKNICAGCSVQEFAMMSGLPHMAYLNAILKTVRGA